VFEAARASKIYASLKEEEDDDEDVWPSSQSQANVSRLVSMIFNPSASVPRLSVHMKSLPTKVSCLLLRL
jgi:hypothetical protein